MKKILSEIIIFIIIMALFTVVMIAAGKHIRSIENNPNGYNKNGHAYGIKLIK